MPRDSAGHLIPGRVGPSRRVPATIARPEDVGRPGPRPYEGDDRYSPHEIARIRTPGPIAAQAAEAVARIAPAMVVPIHWGTYFPIHAPKRYRYLLTEPAKKFRERCAELAPDVRVEVIEPGNSLVIPSG